MATRGRKAGAAAPMEVVDATLDQDKITGAMVQMRADGVAERQLHEADLFDLGRQVGAVQMAQLQRNFSAAAEIRLFEEIKKSNKFKGLPLRRPDGSSAAAENLAEFCDLVFGAGYKSMMEASQNLELLGEASYEAANRLGLNRKQLRLIRSLPSEQQAAVQEALKSDNKAEVVAVIEDLAAQLVEATEATTEARAELEAKEQLLTDKNAKIDQLKAAQKRIAKLPADEQLQALQKEATSIMHDACGCIEGGLRQAVIAINNHGDNEDHTPFLSGLVGQVQARLNALREEYSLPDVSNSAEMVLMAESQQWGNDTRAKG